MRQKFVSTTKCPAAFYHRETLIIREPRRLAKFIILLIINAGIRTIKVYLLEWIREKDEKCDDEKKQKKKHESSLVVFRQFNLL